MDTEHFIQHIIVVLTIHSINLPGNPFSPLTVVPGMPDSP